MQFLQRVRMLREFNLARRTFRDANPDWSEEECCMAALDGMKEKYGAAPDWPAIFKLLFEFLLKLLPFIFLADEEG